MLLQRTLYALQSLKYLFFEVLKKTLLVTGVSAYIHTSYMTGGKDFIFVSSLFFLSVVLVSYVIFYLWKFKEVPTGAYVTD